MIKGNGSAPEYSGSPIQMMDHAKLRKEQAVANIKEMQAEELAKKLVQAKKVARDAYNEGRRVRDRIQALAIKLGPELACETDPRTVTIILKREIRAALAGLAGEDPNDQVSTS